MRRGRAPDDLSSLPYSVDEIRLKIRRRAGDNKPRLTGRGQGKSSKIVMRDIALLAGMTKQNLYRFISGNRQTGLKVLRRLCKTLAEVEGGHWTKFSYGIYRYHDTPQVPPVREMRIDLSTGRITGEMRQSAPVKKMPDFAKLFGGVK